MATIPQSLQPTTQLPQKPPTITERKLIKQYGSVERGKAVQKQKQEVISPILEQQKIQQQNISNIQKQLSEAQKQMQNIEARRSEAVKGASGNVGLRRALNQRFQAEKEAVNVKMIALREGLSIAKSRAVDPQQLQDYISQVETFTIQKGKASEKQTEQLREYKQVEKQQQQVYEGVVEKFGMELTPQEIIQLTPEQARVVNVSQGDISSARSSLQIGTTPTSVQPVSVKVTPGFTNKQLSNLNQEFKSNNPKLRGETAYEYNVRITEDPAYQQRVREITSQPEVREQIISGAEQKGFLGTGYGEEFTSIPLTKVESRKLGEMAASTRPPEAKFNTWEDLVEGGVSLWKGTPGTKFVEEATLKPLARGVRDTFGLIGAGTETYASATELSPIGKKLNLPITNKGLDITKAVGDILQGYETTKQNEVNAKINLENKSNYLAQKIEELNAAQTSEEFQAGLSRIKKKGIKVTEVINEDGTKSYKFDIPIPKALQDKLSADTLAAFFTSASGIAYGGTAAGITGMFGGDRASQETSRIVFGTIGETAPYFAGGIFGGALLAEPFVEKGLYGEKGDLKEYVVEHPVETLLLGAAAVGVGYGAVRKSKIAKQFKSYNAAKEEVKIVNKYLDTIRTTRGKGITVGTKTINKVTQNEILQLEKLGISKEIINQLQRGSGSMTSTAFQKTIATVEKTSKGFYKVNPAGKTIKFYNNQLTMTFLKDGKSVTFTFVSTSKKPLTAYREPLKSFFKYGTNKQIITGVPADGFTAISMSRFWGGEARGTRSFLAKETTEDLTEAMIKQKLRQVDIRETKGIEKYTDDFAEAFGFSPRVSKKVFKTKGGKITEPFVDVSIDVTKPSRAILTTQMGTQQPFVGKGVTITEPIVGDPFLNLLVRKQSIIKKTAVKPKVIKIKPPPSTEINMLNLIDDTITKGGKPITTKVIKPVTKPTRDIISAQEAATQSFVFTDIKTRTPTFKEPPPSKFSNLFLGEGKFGTLGTIDTGFEFKEDKKIIPQDKISLSADSKIKIDTSAKVIAGVKVKPGTKENVKPSLGLTGFESMSMPGVEEGIKESQLVSPVVLSKVTTKEITKSELTQPEISVGGTGGIGGSDFLFPEETTRFKIPIDLDLGGPSFRKGERTGFNAFVKSKGKYKQVTDKPYNRFGAMDIGSRIVDNTTSAQFKIEPIKQTKVIRGKKQELIRRFQEDELAKGDGYYDSTKSKFRNFAIRRGQKIIQQNKWIEKKNKRSDTPGEKRGLSVAQFTSRQSKIKLGLPTRRTKSTKNKRKGYFRL